MRISTNALLALIAMAAMPAHAAAAPATADSCSVVARINASGNILVEQPDAMAGRLERQAADGSDADGSGSTAPSSAASHTPSSTRAGYRIQVFDDNNPRTAHRQALAQKDRMNAAFPAYRAYVVFNSPYWRVKVGDFRSRAEAEAAKNEIIHSFPSMSAYVRIVRDRINVFD